MIIHLRLKHITHSHLAQAGSPPIITAWHTHRLPHSFQDLRTTARIPCPLSSATTWHILPRDLLPLKDKKRPHIASAYCDVYLFADVIPHDLNKLPTCAHLCVLKESLGCNK